MPTPGKTVDGEIRACVGTIRHVRAYRLRQESTGLALRALGQVVSDAFNLRPGA